MAGRGDEDSLFRDAVAGLLRGDFTRLDPLFQPDGPTAPIMAWHAAGLFATEPAALNEALSCACFNGRTAVAELLLDAGVNPAAGNGTGMNGFHWAANRGQLETVKLLLARRAPLEELNSYGGTVLGCTVWSAVNEPLQGQLAVIAALLEGGADAAAAEYPTGKTEVDELLQLYAAGRRGNPAPD